MNKRLGIAAPRNTTNAGHRPASPRRGYVPLEGATPAGMRRSEAEGNRADRRSSARAKRSDRKGSRGKPSAYPPTEGSREAGGYAGCSFSASLLSRKSAALGFGRPRRPRRPRLAGSPLFGRSREARFDYHLKGATRPAERKGNQGTGGTFNVTRSAEAGLGVPISLVGESQGTNQRRRAQGIPSPKATRRAH